MEALFSSCAFFVLIAAQCAATVAARALNDTDEAGPGENPPAVRRARLVWRYSPR